MLRCGLILVFGLTLSAAAADGAKPPKPVRVPPAKMLPLPPAVIDDKLVIGGEDINARKARTRMTVEVNVNGRGPYRFVVDSGADTTVVGWQIAQNLQLPYGTPAVLNGIFAATGKPVRTLPLKNVKLV